MDEMEMLEQFERTEPCDRVRLQFENHGNERWLCLSILKAPKGHCVWCDGPLVGKQRRWCSLKCVKSAQFRSAPQKPDNKVYRLIHLQNWACKGCGLSFEDSLRKKIAQLHKDHNRIKKPEEAEWTRGRYEHEPEKKVTYWQLGDNTGFEFQTDHIIPVHKGGAGIDPANLQVLCLPCHQVKTKKDLRPKIQDQLSMIAETK